MNAQSQREQILAWLKRGNTLTPLEALKMFQCLRLSGRILELREANHDIRTDMVRLDSGKKVARYSLNRPRAITEQIGWLDAQTQAQVNA